MLHVRVFKAVDDLKSCKVFAQEHAQILQEYDITKITSFRGEWFNNPDVYVIVVEVADTMEMVAGERVHIANSSYALPIEQAFLQATNKIYEPVTSFPKDKIIGELGAMWCKKTMEGYGLSQLLSKLGIVVAHLLKVDRLCVLCSPHIVKYSKVFGLEIEMSIGNNGTFSYPNPDLLATAVVLKDMGILSKANTDHRKDIFSMVKNPIGSTITTGKEGSIEVKYNLIPSKQKKRLISATRRHFTKAVKSNIYNYPLSNLSLPLLSDLPVSNHKFGKLVTNYFFIKHLNEGARSPPAHIHI